MTSSKICGWDIGIKNCSFCIIEAVDTNIHTLDSNSIYIEVNNNKYQIKLWDVINVLPEVEKNQINTGNISLDARPTLKCTKVLNQLQLNTDTTNATNLLTSTKEVYCDKLATFCSQDIPLNNDITSNLSPYNYISYCNKHFKECVTENKGQYIYLNDKSKCCYVTDNNKCNCSKVSWVNAKNFYVTYCDKHYKQLLKDELNTEASNTEASKSKFIKIIKNKNVAQLDLTMLGDALFRHFDKIKELCNVDVVLLENQPVLKNPTMKSIQMFLFSYFIINGIQVDTSPCKQIKCYSANQKLDLHKIVTDTDELNNILSKLKGLKNQYSRNKKLAILLVEYILNNCGTNTTELLTFFKEHKKRDDLADSFLMTLHYLESANLKKIKVNDNIKTLIKKAKKTKNTASNDDTSNAQLESDLESAN
jgi:hypothetical protein